MNQYGLNEHSCNKIISSSHLQTIAVSCGAGGVWKFLAPHLKIETHVIDDIDSMRSTDLEKRNEFFKQWKQKEDREATYKSLISAMVKIDRNQDAGKVLQLLKGSIALSTQPSSSHSTPGNHYSILVS